MIGGARVSGASEIGENNEVRDMPGGEKDEG